MPAPILIVEDDTDINNMMAEALTKAGYACTQAFSGTEGLLYLDQGPYALVILDLMLPGLEGEALLPQIKAKTGTPVLVVSAKDSLDSKVGLLTAGAEDYLTKPFAIQELVARAGVQIRRFAQTAGAPPAALHYKDLTLTPETFPVTCQGQPVELTRQEFRILELLPLPTRGGCSPSRPSTTTPGRRCTWGRIRPSTSTSATSGKKLRGVSDREYIETVWASGSAWPRESLPFL